MVWNEIVSLVCICSSAVIFSISLQGQSKRKILFIQMFATALYLLSYLFVITINPAAKIGVITASFEILRLIIFYFIDRSEKYNTKKWNLIAAISFSIILTVCIIIAWSGWYSILPLISAISVSLALGNKDVKLIKIAFIFQAICITTYLFLLGLWPNALAQIFVFVFGVVGLITYITKSKKQIENNDGLSM